MSAASRALHRRWRELGFHPPFYCKALLMSSIHCVVQKNFFPPCEPKAHFLRWWERFRADWYLFHHWHRVYKAQLCNSGGPKCSPGLTWLALKVTPGWVALQNATCLNFLHHSVKNKSNAVEPHSPVQRSKLFWGNLFQKVFCINYTPTWEGAVILYRLS